MAESEPQHQSSPSILARKFRKKLRQIENLERLNRPLTDEECIKVDSKSSIRDQLKEVLERMEEEAERFIASDSSLADNQRFDENLAPEEPVDTRERGLTPAESSSLDTDLPLGSSRQTMSSTAAASGDHVNLAAAPKAHKVPQKQEVKALAKTNSVKERKDGKAGKASTHLSKRLCRVTYLEGHSDIITSLVIVDGRVVTASRDTALKSWDLTTGEELHTFGAHTETVTCVVALDATYGCLIDPSFSPDDHLIISSSFDCTFKMWSVNTGCLLKSVYTFNPLTKICFCPTANRLVTCSDGGKLELWNIATGENSFSTLAYDASVTGIQVSDQTIFSSSAAGVIKVHQIREDGSLACLFVSDEVKTTEGKILTPRHVRCMAKISEGLLFGDDSRNLKLLDWKKGQVSKFPNHTSDFSSTDAVSCHEGYVLTSSYDLDDGLGYINVRQGGTLTYQATLDDQETERIMCLDFCQSADGGLNIASGGVDLKVWHVLPTSASKASSEDDQVIGFEFRQALSISATDSDSESEVDSDDDEDEEGEDDGAGRGAPQRSDGSAQQTGVWSWCTVL